MKAFDRVGPRDERHSCSTHLRLRANLVAHALHHLRRRADEDEVRLLARAHERRVFSKEPVARVNGVAAGRLRRCDDVRDPEVASSGGRADADRAVRDLDVQRLQSAVE